MNLLKIEWWNDHDLGDILYQDGFKNRIYLDVEVDKPEYNTTIESDLNGDAVEIAKFRKWEKVYKLECWMQEDLVDAFSLMQIHDNIEVTLQSGDVIQVAKHGMRVEPSWEEIGCLAKCIVSFTENYVVAGNCDENMEVGCLCDNPGEFLKIEEYSTLGAGNNGDVVLAWTVENNPGKKYTASLYQLHKDLDQYWFQLPVPDQYACYQNHDDSSIWIFDGQFWQLFPGYIISLTKTGGFHVTVMAWLAPGAFGTIYYDGGMGWVDLGDFTADELTAGVDVETTGAGSLPVKITVWNHSFAYGDTLDAHVTMP